MNNLVVTCKQCGADVELTESLAAPMLAEAQEQFRSQLKKKDEEVGHLRAEMEERRQVLEAAEAALDDTVEHRLAVERKKLSDAAVKAARAELQLEMEEKSGALAIAELELAAQKKALARAKDKEAALLNAQKSFEKEKEEIESKVELRLKQEMDASKQSLEKGFEAELAARLREKDLEIIAIKEREEKKARASAKMELDRKEAELEEAQALLATANDKIAMAAEAEAALLKQKRTLEAEKRSLELTVQTRVGEEIESLRESMKGELETDFKLRLREKDTQLQSMKTEIENLRRKSEQGSQQLQGEAYEQEISERLAQSFPDDDIKRVGKGKAGGDCLQEVRDQQGRLCGTIIWESKRTSKWNDGWLEKLKGDQHTAKADVAIIVSQHLPKGVETFERRGEIWVAGLDCLIPVAGALRHLLIEVAGTRRANEGREDKASLIYEYVTSVAFRQRVQAMTGAFRSMQADLIAEQSAMKRMWAKRQTQLDKMSSATDGMYGDLQGIAGQSVPELDGTGFDALGTGE